MEPRRGTRRTIRVTAPIVVIALAAACSAAAPTDVGTGTPIPSSGRAITRISAGGYHTCVVVADGSISCWGLGDYGQLGTGSTGTSAAPAAVVAPDGVTFTDVVAGNAHTCAIASGGAVWCWGVDLDGGDEADLNATHGPTPVALPDAPRITSIDGYYHACAIAEDGAAWCWGRGSEGQLGDGASTDAPEPVAVTRPDGVAFERVATGAFHTCALDAGGAVWCWGRGVDDVPLEIPMPGGAAVAAIAAGFAHTCALTDDGTAWCWGGGADGELGDGDTADASGPVAVTMPDGVRFSAIDAGNAHTCAIATDGSVWCWGLGIQGGATDGSPSLVPVEVVIPADAAATAISAGGFHTCALRADGTAWCWGDDSLGQLGDGTAGGTAGPTRVPFAP